MQHFEAVFVIAVIFALGALLRHAIAPRLDARLYLGAAAVLALAAGILDFTISPREYAREFASRDLVSLQFVELGPHAAFPGQRALVAMPTLLPLPTITGRMVAVAPRGAGLTTVWEGQVLWVEARDAEGRAVRLSCGDTMARSLTVVHGVLPAPPCNALP